MALGTCCLGSNESLMHDPLFRIQELNPFQEWHLHGSANDWENALVWAGDICQQLEVPVRVLNREDNVVAVFQPQAG